MLKRARPLPVTTEPPLNYNHYVIISKHKRHARKFFYYQNVLLCYFGSLLVKCQAQAATNSGDVHVADIAG
jgi:hypothetical protein